MTDISFAPSRQVLIDQLLSRGFLGNGYLFHGQTGSFISDAASYIITHIMGSNTASNPDIITIKTHPKKITVDVIREIQDRVKYGPSHHDHMIVVLHHVDQMTTEAANAFLKTLEEAEKGVTFILLTHQFHQILPTIKSRCQHLYFPPLTEEELKQKCLAHPNLWEMCHGQVELVLDYLEHDGTPPEQYLSCADVKKLSLTEKFQLSEAMAKDKETLEKILLCWLRESLSTPSQETPDALIQMVTLIRRIKIPLNLRLHLDAIMISLHTPCLVQTHNLA